MSSSLERPIAKPVRGVRKYIGTNAALLATGAGGASLFPNLLGGTNVILAVNSFVANSICSGNTYSYRVDTSEALTWIRATVAQHHANL